MSQKNKVLLSLVMLVSTAIANATSLPPAPTMDIMASPKSCSQYTRFLAKYYDEQPQMADFLNEGWFNRFASTQSALFFQQHCENNVCVNAWDYNGSAGLDGGCFVAGINLPGAKEKAFAILQEAYNVALTHTAVKPVGFGFVGPGSGNNTCQSSDGYQYCELRIA